MATVLSINVGNILLIKFDKGNNTCDVKIELLSNSLDLRSVGSSLKSSPVWGNSVAITIHLTHVIKAD